MVENELSDTRRVIEAARNESITTGITGVTTIVEKSQEVVINWESDSEGKNDFLVYEVNLHDIEREMKFMVETVDEEEEVYTAANIRYTNRQRHKTTRYEPKFQGKRYKDDSGAMLLNYG